MTLSRRKKTLFSVAALALLLAAAELGMRWTGSGQDPAERFFADVYDPIPRLIPGAANPYAATAEFLNTKGLRGPQFTDRKQPGTFRIVCLGDSQTFGAGTHEESYPAQLQRTLDDRVGAGSIEVVNAGIHGTNIYQQRLFFEDFFAAKDVDLLLVMSGPNCRADLQAYRERADDAGYRALRRAHRLMARSAAYRSLRGALKRGARTRVLDDSQIYVGGHCDQGTYRRDYEADLAALATLAKKRAFALAFVASSNERSIEQLVAEGADPDGAGFFGRAVAAHYDAFLPSFAAREGIPFIQYWGDFVRHADRPEGLWHDPDHANAFGNALIAGRIAEELKAWNPTLFQ